MNPSVTFFDSITANRKREQVLSIQQLAELIRTTTAPAKESLPWLKLARFGGGRSPLGSLRHDRNMIAISGVEADYDGERLEFNDAVEIADKAGLLAILYTSPSHRPATPRWRMLCPASGEFPPKDRARLLGRLNGLYRGIFGRESWTLSQSYYFGAVAGNPHHQVELVDGLPLDRLDELDAIWLGPPAATNGHNHSAASAEASGEARADAELIRRIISGDGFHCELTALAARYIGRAMDPQAIVDTLRGIMLAHHETARDARWTDRYRSIPRIVASAKQKYAPEAERRRAVARITHRMVRQRLAADDIKAAILAEAERLGLSPECALAIGSNILHDAVNGGGRG